MTTPPRCVEPDIEGKDAAGLVERVDPEKAPRGVMAVHLARYAFAKSFAEGKSVLDVACGAGYGSAVIADVARRVVGMDRSGTAVRYALTRYRRANAAFLVGDAGRLPFPEASFETVVSFETIEHLPDIPRYLEEVRRVLRPGGEFVVSTPKARKTTTRPANPHHTIEYSAQDFEALLGQFFARVDLYGQVRVQNGILRWLRRVDVLGLRRFVPTGARRGIQRSLQTAPFAEMDVSDQRIVAGGLSRAEYVLAVCAG